jgi:hypothetical protein
VHIQRVASRRRRAANGLMALSLAGLVGLVALFYFLLSR